MEAKRGLTRALEAAGAARTHRLLGFEADNMLAFMALLGLLRVLELEKPGWRARVRWACDRPPIRPELVLQEPATAIAVAESAIAGCRKLAPAYLFTTLGKKWASIGVSTAAIIIVPLPVVLRLVGWFPENRTPMVLPLLMLFNLIGITLLIASNILFSSMVADVAEDSEVTTGRRSEGVFTAATLFVQKATSGIGIFASSLLLGAIGFPRSAAACDRR